MQPLAWALFELEKDNAAALNEARVWLLKAAKSGDVPAMCNLVRFPTHTHTYIAHGRKQSLIHF